MTRVGLTSRRRREQGVFRSALPICGAIYHEFHLVLAGDRLSHDLVGLFAAGRYPAIGANLKRRVEEGRQAVGRLGIHEPKDLPGVVVDVDAGGGLIRQAPEDHLGLRPIAVAIERRACLGLDEGTLWQLIMAPSTMPRQTSSSLRVLGGFWSMTTSSSASALDVRSTVSTLPVRDCPESLFCSSLTNCPRMPPLPK